LEFEESLYHKIWFSISKKKNEWKSIVEYCCSSEKEIVRKMICSENEKSSTGSLSLSGRLVVCVRTMSYGTASSDSDSELELTVVHSVRF
jgi:hypothetical protein